MQGVGGGLCQDGAELARSIPLLAPWASWDSERWSNLPVDPGLLSSPVEPAHQLINTQSLGFRWTGGRYFLFLEKLGQFRGYLGDQPPRGNKTESEWPSANPPPPLSIRLPQLWMDLLSVTACALSSIRLQRGWAKLFSNINCFWHCTVFVALCGLSLVAASGGYPWLRGGGFSGCRAQAPGVWASVVAVHGPGSAGSGAVAYGLSCSEAYGIFPDQESNLCPRLWQMDSCPLYRRGSPTDLKEMEEEVKYMDSYAQGFPLILSGVTQLGSELAGRP